MALRTASGVDSMLRGRVRHTARPLFPVMQTPAAQPVQSPLMVRPDRRHHDRHLVMAGAVAMFSAGPSRLTHIGAMSMGEIGMAIMAARPSKMGPIVDIGPGGMAFRYVAGRKTATEDNDDYRLDIVVAEHRAVLHDLPYEIVAVRSANTSDPSPLASGIVALCFDEMSEYQLAALKHFLQKYAID